MHSLLQDSSRFAWVITEQGLSKEMRIQPAALQNAEYLQDLQLHFAQNSEGCSSEGIAVQKCKQTNKQNKQILHNPAMLVTCPAIRDKKYCWFITSSPHQIKWTDPVENQWPGSAQNQPGSSRKDLSFSDTYRAYRVSTKRTKSRWIQLLAIWLIISLHFYF